MNGRRFLLTSVGGVLAAPLAGEVLIEYRWADAHADLSPRSRPGNVALLFYDRSDGRTGVAV